MRRSFRLLRSVRRKSIPLDDLQSLFSSLRLSGPDYQFQGLHDASSSTKWNVFYPLFTNTFAFENHQLTTLGDALIDDYLSTVFGNYFLDMGIVATHSTVKQLNAIFHNHFTMRLFAEEHGFMTLASPLDDTKINSLSDTEEDLSFLVPATTGPRTQDLAGTSFDFVPLRSGQSNLGWKFSHFIGALFQTYQQEAVTTVLETVFDLQSSSNIPSKATKLLLRLLSKYPASNVAEAILAAQGVDVQFQGRSVMEEGEASESHNRTQQSKQGSSPVSETKQAANEAPSGTESTAVAAPPALESNPLLPAASATLEGFASAFDGPLEEQRREVVALASLAAGPGGFDAVGTWKRREASALAASAVALNVSDPHNVIGSGWLTPEEQSQAGRGPAYTGFTDFSRVRFFADTVGIPAPEQGKRIERKTFFKNVQDKQFFDTQSDLRKGIPFATNGLSVPEYLSALSKPHNRRFEVSMINGFDGKVIGKAIAPRYTEAREAVCKGYLLAVVKDVQSLMESTW